MDILIKREAVMQNLEHMIKYKKELNDIEITTLRLALEYVKCVDEISKQVEVEKNDGEID